MGLNRVVRKRREWISRLFYVWVKKKVLLATIIMIKYYHNYYISVEYRENGLSHYTEYI